MTGTPADKVGLEALDSLASVATLLGTTAKKLAFILYGRPEAQRYSSFSIPKRRGGRRTIVAPRDDLKGLQRRFATMLSRVYRPRHSVHGFVDGRSILSNAKKHVRKRYVFNVDLKRFFPTINFGRVRGLFLKIGIPESGATILAQLCCHDGALPQGAPTSPIVSNMVCVRLDRQLGELAKEHRCVYSRYADDITFSKQRAGFPGPIGSMDEIGNALAGPMLRRVIEENGFRINTDKTRLFNNQHRQSVTGLIVNSQCNVPRSFIRQIRAMIHAWGKFGYDAAKEEHHSTYYRRQGKRGELPSFESILCGKLAFVKMVRGLGDPVYRNLQRQFVHVCPGYEEVMWKENQQMDARDVFISHASDDNDVARPLAEELVRAGVSVWFDEYEIEIGDDLREKIDEGLRKSKFGVVILSKSFFATKKTWTRRELSGLTAAEDSDGQRRTLPIWHKLDQADVAKYSPIVAGLVAMKTQEHSISDIAAAIKSKVRPT